MKSTAEISSNDMNLSVCNSSAKRLFLQYCSKERVAQHSRLGPLRVVCRVCRIERPIAWLVVQVRGFPFAELFPYPFLRTKPVLPEFVGYLTLWLELCDVDGATQGRAVHPGVNSGRTREQKARREKKYDDASQSRY